MRAVQVCRRYGLGWLEANRAQARPGCLFLKQTHGQVFGLTVPEYILEQMGYEVKVFTHTLRDSREL